MRARSRQNPLTKIVVSLFVGWLVLSGFVGVALAATPPPGASLVVSSQVDKTRLAEDEPLTFSITIAGPIKTAPRVNIASLEGFQVLSTGQSQQVNVRGGAMQLAVTLHYLLLPAAPGRHRLGPVTVEYEGRRYETSPIEVEVVPSERPAPRAGPRRPAIHGGTVL